VKKTNSKEKKEKKKTNLLMISIGKDNGMIIDRAIIAEINVEIIPLIPLFS